MLRYLKIVKEWYYLYIQDSTKLLGKEEMLHRQ